MRIRTSSGVLSSQDVRHLNPSEQIKVKAADRLRVLQMPAEKEAD